MNPNKFDETKWFLSAIDARNEKLKTSIDLYKISLENEIQVRDLSEEKIKNASILGIKLPTFKGYDSHMDFYTFKTEFEKLVAPRIQAKLLPEYLKNNYMEGQALEIVREIDNIEEIWLRMKFSFGNVVSLLSNKLKEIENDVPLWQTKDDEKLIKAITKIKTCMMELSNLVRKHDIETSLFHHSNTVNIFRIIGKKRQNDVMIKLIESDYNEKNIWYEIINYLEKEIRIKFENSERERKIPSVQCRSFEK